MEGRQVGAVVAAAGAAAALTLALAPPAYAEDTTVTVRGTSFPGPQSAQLSFVGCATLYDRTVELLQPYISRGNAPAGRRSLGYDLAGGNAVGSLHAVGSMADTTVASLAVHAPDGATGVAYAGYQEPADEGTDLVWFGRAELTAPAGRWTAVDATGLTYDWVKYDLATRTVPAPVPDASVVPAMPVADFMRSRGGDGPGLYTIGFGCDGNRFTMDALRIGSTGSVTTYDLEGLTSTLSISGGPVRVAPGEAVTIRGAVRSSTGNRIPHATVILEERALGSKSWQPVQVADADPDDASVTVRPTVSTVYRWRFVDRPAHEGSISPVFAILVERPTAPEEPDDPPSPSPSPTPSPSPSATPSSEPSATASSEASPSASPTAVESAGASLTP